MEQEDGGPPNTSFEETMDAAGYRHQEDQNDTSMSDPQIEIYFKFPFNFIVTFFEIFLKFISKRYDLNFPLCQICNFS